MTVQLVRRNRNSGNGELGRDSVNQDGEGYIIAEIGARNRQGVKTRIEKVQADIDISVDSTW
jgi:hypothetical protein